MNKLISIAVVALSIAVVTSLASFNPADPRSAAAQNDDPLRLTMEQRTRIAYIIRNEVAAISTAISDPDLTATAQKDQMALIIQKAKMDGVKILTPEQHQILSALKGKHQAAIQAQAADPTAVFVQQIVTEDDVHGFPWLFFATGR